MVKIKIPKDLPECDLISVLAEKVEQRKDIDFNFFGRLDEFCQRVSGEVRQINVLFPEYTPHDEQYHLKRLFHVADTILGRNLIEAMNSAELFLLAIALYGHDWGMAVSESEKEYIITGKPPEEIRAEDLWILFDEHLRFAKFAREQRLSMDADGHVKEIPIEIWREYVRQTHAFRSGERVRRFFDPIDPGIADTSSRICVGHWLNFEDLEDYRSYPPDFSVLSETANLRALTVYLRLIDLLDLADDRTPYVIWKFVAPRDPRSKMEWVKHRALRPVTCPPYQAGRIIRVDGSTDDHEVYAALEDLRIWCGDQLRGCNDLLARMNDPRHKLDLYHIDWRVTARGFNPVSIQFEFDRERMFEILSDEIYQGDPYVFLRELLQNSIDAIRMRREVLQRKGIDPGNLGVIRVTVEHGTGGDAIVTWQDDGIGMDEYIVRNYLAVAGKSYYTSLDFEREGLKMDPISRFGVGILSCFMVADRIQIETFKEPYLPPTGNPIRITIPAVRRQFRIETLPQEGAHVGTTVRVFVDGKKIPADEQGKPAQPLNVTGYLSIVAGFVEFPIFIEEGDRKTIVLHPKQDAKAARQRFGEDFSAHQIDLSYPWDRAILPQDIPIAREFFREQRWDIASDLHPEGYEGVLTYLLPMDDGIDLIPHSGEFEVVKRGHAEHTTKRVRFPPYKRVHPVTDLDVGLIHDREAVGLNRSSTHSTTYAVYRDGILLPEAPPPISDNRGKTITIAISEDTVSFYQALLKPRLVVNLSKSRAPRVDLARRQLLGQLEHWASPVFEAHLRHLFGMWSEGLLAFDPAERLYELGRVIAFHHIEAESLWEVFPHERWPVPFLEADGHLNVIEWQEVANHPIYLYPEPLGDELQEIYRSRWLTKEEYKGPLVKWKGERCVASNFVNGVSSVSQAIDMAAGLWQIPVQKTHSFTGIRFLHPPWEGDPPLFQEIWVPTEVPKELPGVEEVLRKAARDPGLLSSSETEVLRKSLFESVSYNFPRIIEFPKPLSEFFAYGDKLLNLKHPVTRALLRFLAAFTLSRNRRSLPPDLLGHLEDALKQIFYFDPELKEWSNALRRVGSLAREVQLIDEDALRDSVLTKKEIVPGTIGMSRYNVRDILIRMKSVQPFGEPLA
jgi:hypothetical protein